MEARKQSGEQCQTWRGQGPHIDINITLCLHDPQTNPEVKCTLLTPRQLSNQLRWQLSFSVTRSVQQCIWQTWWPWVYLGGNDTAPSREDKRKAALRPEVCKTGSSESNIWSAIHKGWVLHYLNPVINCYLDEQM